MATLLALLSMTFYIIGLVCTIAIVIAPFILIVALLIYLNKNDKGGKKS